MLRLLPHLLIAAAIGSSASLHAATFNVTLQPRAQDAHGPAHYRLWIPDGVETLRGIIVRQHGCSEGARRLGREHADDPQWQALAAKWDCALLGSQLWAPQEDCSTWTVPQDGSARTFLTALRQLAQQSRHPELEFVPWCLWGHSGGAMWTCNMTYRYPERVIAAFPRSGGLAPIGRTYTRSQPAGFDESPRAFDVPIMFCFGEKEDIEGTRFHAGVAAARQLFEFGRRHDALWSLAVHPGSEHENSNSRQLAIRFFDSCLALRLPPAAPEAHAPISPLAVGRDKSWCADLTRRKLFRASEFRGDAAALAWLPDTSSAMAWKEFSERGAISDKTPPPAPQNVTVTASAEGIDLMWDASADVESGIDSFRIYSDGRQIGEVRGLVNNRWNPHGHYHAWNYSDQPLNGTEFPARTFRDARPDRPQQAAYTVTTVNQAGLESAPTAPLKH